MRRTKGRQPCVVDTNVPVVANRRQGESRTCANACAQALLNIKKSGLLVLDDQDGILKEYRGHLSLSGQPGVGDSFVKWAHDNAGRQDLVQRVRITPSPGTAKEFQEFPDSAELTGFDRSDQKFVAVALSHSQNPPILNGTDQDWWNYRKALKAAGVQVRFLCPERFQTDGGHRSADQGGNPAPPLVGFPPPVALEYVRSNSAKSVIGG